MNRVQLAACRPIDRHHIFFSTSFAVGRFIVLRDTWTRGSRLTAELSAVLRIRESGLFTRQGGLM
jgi:hypothetical protein